MLGHDHKNQTHNLLNSPRRDRRSDAARSGVGNEINLRTEASLLIEKIRGDPDLMPEAKPRVGAVYRFKQYDHISCNLGSWDL